MGIITGVVGCISALNIARGQKDIILDGVTASLHLFNQSIPCSHIQRLEVRINVTTDSESEKSTLTYPVWVVLHDPAEPVRISNGRAEHSRDNARVFAEFVASHIGIEVIHEVLPSETPGILPDPALRNLR